MKKFLALILAATLLLTLCACGGGKSSGDAKENTDTPAEAKTYDVGEFTVSVPGGWTEFPITALDGSGNDTNSIDLYKGDSMFGGHPYIRIDYYGPSTTMMALSSDFYDDVEELEAFELGGHTWSGFKCTSFDMPLINLQSEAGDHEFQLAIWCEQTNGSISLEDADVKAIIESLTPNA